MSHAYSRFTSREDLNSEQFFYWIKIIALHKAARVLNSVILKDRRLIVSRLNRYVVQAENHSLWVKKNVGFSRLKCKLECLVLRVI